MNKVVTEIIATDVKVQCPHCHEYIDGWAVDPRGVVDTCDHCGKVYEIHADIDMY